MVTTGTQALLAHLRRLNRTGVFLTALVLVLAGLLLPRPYGGIVLLLLAAALAALLSITWPVGTSANRIARLVILALLVALAIFRLG
jgi:Family of unknown function (DUF6703)